MIAYPWVGWRGKGSVRYRRSGVLFSKGLSSYSTAIPRPPSDLRFVSLMLALFEEVTYCISCLQLVFSSSFGYSTCSRVSSFPFHFFHFLANQPYATLSYLPINTRDPRKSNQINQSIARS